MEKQKQKQSWLSTASFSLLFIVIVFTLFEFWKSYQATQELARLKTSVVNQQAEIKKINQEDGLAALKQHFKIVNQLEGDQIVWSEKALNIFKIFEAVGGLKIKTFTSDQKGSFNIHLEAESTQKIGILITTLREYELTSEPFVSNVSQQKNAQSDFEYQAQLHFNYPI